MESTSSIRRRPRPTTSVDDRAQVRPWPSCGETPHRPVTGTDTTDAQDESRQHRSGIHHHRPSTVYRLLMRTVAFLNKKGGVGKTTTAVGLATGLARAGLRVGVIDADPNGSASRWLETIAEVDFVPCRAADLVALLASVADDYDVVVIDSAPNDADAIVQIAALADLVLVPLAPSPIEVDQLGDTVALFDASKPTWLVVPVRVRLSTSAGRSIRELCLEQGVPVTTAVVPLSEAVARSFGELPPPLSYSALAREVQAHLDLAVVAR